jgi:hypothetical protein
MGLQVHRSLLESAPRHYRLSIQRKRSVSQLVLDGLAGSSVGSARVRFNLFRPFNLLLYTPLDFQIGSDKIGATSEWHMGDDRLLLTP